MAAEEEAAAKAAAAERIAHLEAQRLKAMELLIEAQKQELAAVIREKEEAHGKMSGLQREIQTTENKAKQTESARKTIASGCAACGTSGSSKMCGRCQATAYCSREVIALHLLFLDSVSFVSVSCLRKKKIAGCWQCQVKHWPTHKKECAARRNKA